MNKVRALVFAACAIAVPLALGAGVDAAEPSTGAMVLYDAAGRPVATLTPIQQTTASASPAWDLLGQVQASARRPMADPFAQMDAQMNAMMAHMTALMGMPFPSGPGGMLDAAVMPGGAGQVYITTFSAGAHGSCSETITYRSDGSGVQPQVAMHRVGDACRAGTAARPMPAAAPDNDVQPPPAVTPANRIYNIDYRHKAGSKRPLHD